LQLIGEPPNDQIATEAQRRSGVIQPPLGAPQLLVERSTSRAISPSTSARSWLQCRSLRASFALRPENGSPERWRAEASWIGDVIGSPARRCGRPGHAALGPRQE
jgi:hypothetical protein